MACYASISDNNLCQCNQIEAVEHYLLHCEMYFNEREALRTKRFNTNSTPELTCEFLCSVKSDFRKIHEKTFPPRWLAFTKK